MELALIHQRNNNILEKIDFIFDTTDKDAMEIDRVFRQTMFTAPERIKALKLIDNPPVFRDDKVFLPLQAADLLAGQIRGWQEYGNETPAMRRLSDHGPKVAYVIHDAKNLTPIVQGAELARNYMLAGGPGQELARFNTMKQFVETLTELYRQGYR